MCVLVSEKPRKASIDIQEQAEGTEYSHLFCTYRAVLMFGFPTDIPEFSCRKRKLRWQSYCCLHLPKIGGCMEDEDRLSFRLHNRRTGGYRQVAMWQIEILEKNSQWKSSKGWKGHWKRVSRGCVVSIHEDDQDSTKQDLGQPHLTMKIALFWAEHLSGWPPVVLSKINSSMIP